MAGQPQDCGGRSCPCRQPVRWAPATGQHTGAGSIVALAAQPVAWAAAWPGAPGRSTAVHLVHVDTQGKPALDRPSQDGRRLRRSAPSAKLQGAAVILLGNPQLPEAAAPVHVAEGLADALALASRIEGTSVAALGTSGMMGQDQILAQWLARAQLRASRSTAIPTKPKQGRPPAGRRAAAVLMLAIKDAGGQALIVTPAQGFKDFADECGRRARTSAHCPRVGSTTPGPSERQPTWPRWEISRVATVIMQELSNDD